MTITNVDDVAHLSRKKHSSRLLVETLAYTNTMWCCPDLENVGEAAMPWRQKGIATVSIDPTVSGFRSDKLMSPACFHYTTSLTERG